MRKGIPQSILEEGARALGRAAGAVLSDPRGQEALARAVGLAQRGLQLIESAQAHALHAAGLAARPDYDDIRKQVARLKRKARELTQQLDGTSDPVADSPRATRADDDSGSSGDDGSR